MTIFTPVNGGVGVRISCDSSSGSTRTAIPSPSLGTVYRILNIGTDYVSLAVGDNSIAATTACMTFAPGESFLGIPNAGGGSAPTYIAGITTGATVVVQVTLGTMT